MIKKIIEQERTDLEIQEHAKAILIREDDKVCTIVKEVIEIDQELGEKLQDAIDWIVGEYSDIYFEEGFKRGMKLVKEVIAV